MACPIVAKKSGSSHLFWGGPKLGCSDGLPAGIIGAMTFCLTSYPAEIAYFNSPNRELSNGAQAMELL